MSRRWSKVTILLITIMGCCMVFVTCGSPLSQAPTTVTQSPGLTSIPQPNPTQGLTPISQPSATPTPSLTPGLTSIPQPPATPTPHSVQEINNNDPGISYTGSCGYNYGLSTTLYDNDVEICKQQNDSFTYTFTGTNIYLITVYYQNHGGIISCYIDGSFTQSYNLDSSDGVDSSGLRYGVVLPIATQLTYAQHTASCTMTSASGTYFFVDALIINM